MPEPTIATSEGSRPIQFWQWLLLAAATVLIAIAFFSPAREVTDPTLDRSNYGSYAYFTARGFAFGPDVIPMAGPYGFVPYGFLYAGILFWKRWILELLTKLVLGLLVVWHLRRAPAGTLRWLWLIALLVMAPLVEDLPYDMAVLLTGLSLVECHLSPGSRRFWQCLGLSAYLALLTLFKGTQALLAAATLGLLLLQALQAREFRRWLWLASTYLATLIILLIIAGQTPMHTGAYWRGILELSSGYNAAMVLEEPFPVFLTGAGSLLCLIGMLIVMAFRGWSNPRLLAGALLLAGFSFVEWKHGFVRADGHVYIYYQYVCIAAPTILLLSQTLPLDKLAGGTHRIITALGILAFAAGLWGDGLQPWQRHLTTLRELPVRAGAAMDQLLHPALDKQRLEAALEQNRATFELPQLRAIVGSARIDFFGTEHGYLSLNRMNYRPRPMGGGSFNVFTPWLQDQNAAYVANPATRPEYYLTHLQTIDERLLAQDDAGALQNIAQLYRPVATEQGLVLFQARAGSPKTTVPRWLETRPIAFDSPVLPPAVGADELLLCTISAPLSLTGKLRGFLYKPPLVFMSLEGSGISQPGFRRIVPTMFTRPIQLDPVLEDTRDLVALFQNVRGKSVNRVTLHTRQPGLFAADQISISFYAAPRPPREQEIADRLLEVLRFPLANVPPATIQSPNSPDRQLGGLPIRQLEPPGLIRFALTGHETSIDFLYGIDPLAYTTGKTNGVRFMVEVQKPGRPPELVFDRLLDPVTKSLDRGPQESRAVLPPVPAGTQLNLRTDAGPGGDAAWDWAYFSRIRLVAGSYIPEQFPRFQTLPIAVEGVTVGRMTYDQRDIFMLNSPGALMFLLHGTEQQLSFRAGLLPGAYTAGGQSDGVEFITELLSPDGTKQIIARQQLNPRDNPADRGDRPFEVALPQVPAGTRLRLTVSPGPTGSDAWDWSYFESLTIK
jgi:hypothetical protein